MKTGRKLSRPSRVHDAAGSSELYGSRRCRRGALRWCFQCQALEKQFTLGFVEPAMVAPLQIQHQRQLPAMQAFTGVALDALSRGWPKEELG